MSSCLNNNSDVFSEVTNLDNWKILKTQMNSIVNASKLSDRNELTLRLKKIALDIQNIRCVENVSNPSYNISQREYDSQVGKLDKLLETYRYVPKPSSLDSEWNLHIVPSEKEQTIWTALKQDLRFANDPRKKERAFIHRHRNFEALV